MKRGALIECEENEEAIKPVVVQKVVEVKKDPLEGLDGNEEAQEDVKPVVDEVDPGIVSI